MNFSEQLLSRVDLVLWPLPNQRFPQWEAEEALTPGKMEKDRKLAMRLPDGEKAPGEFWQRPVLLSQEKCCVHDLLFRAGLSAVLAGRSFNSS